MDLQEQIKTYASQLSELSLRAKKINYKNNIPQLPKKPSAITLAGFRKRLSNWTEGLNLLEAERMRGTLSSDPNLLKNYLRK